MSFKAFLQADLIKNLAMFSEGNLMDAGALLRGLEISGPFPDFVNTKNDDGEELEYLVSDDIAGFIGRVDGYGEEWLMVFSYSLFRHQITVKALARYADVNLETFVQADALDHKDSIPLETWLTHLSPAQQSQIDSLHQRITAPQIAQRRLLSARHNALAEAKTLFNFSQTGLLSFETRCDYLMDLLRKELGQDVELTLCAQFKDGTRIESSSFSGLGKLNQSC